MPRTPPWLFRQAKRYSPHAASLLLACRSLPLALNELRWIKEYVNHNIRPAHRARRLQQLCQKRGRGVPLQYVLRSQPFGPLEIRCRPGVLIPRTETEAYTYHLAHEIKRWRRRDGIHELKVLDMCTGTGCIPLLLFTLLQQSFKSLQVQGVDVSLEAVNLASQNLAYNGSLGHLSIVPGQKCIEISQGDIFCDTDMQGIMSIKWDVMTSNPPYISQDVWNSGRGQMGHSVRKFEPALALVPGAHLEPPPGWQTPDVFYARLLDMANKIRPKLVLLEIGDEPQAIRVVENYFRHPMASYSTIELWRDTPDVDSGTDGRQVQAGSRNGENQLVHVKGSGNIRSILIRNNL
ncbi:hypothetical protein NQ176_g8782 [Zarea fungicola]|uniref:Uncharacterized protein n=1 Tax=Zarea fungicola TaxID=93591 RepID=A0ACC1MQI1_9HYPO|nr:hypothetical protein NQ176_g8782 [Lecanicillium fungicola]